jgi:hypothetical protein
LGRIWAHFLILCLRHKIKKPGYPLQFLKKRLRRFSAGFPLLSLARPRLTARALPLKESLCYCRRMTLFLVAGLPLFFAAFLVFFFPGIRYRETLFAAGKGALSFIPFCIVYVFFSDLIPASQGTPGFYYARTVSDFLLPLAFCALFAFLWRRKKPGRGKELFLFLAAFFTGFFTFFAQYTLITFSLWYADYLYFLLPLSWMALGILAPLTAVWLYDIFGKGRLVFTGVPAVLPFLFGCVPWLHAENNGFFAWLVTLLLFAAALVCARRARLS